MRPTSVVSLLLLALLISAPAMAQMITFEGDDGSPPKAFDFSRTGQGSEGEWRVVRDETAEKGYALEQASTDKTDYRFPLAIYNPLSAADVEVSVRFKPVAGQVDRAGGIAVRLTNANNYYVVRANALEDNVRFYRVVNGKREQLRSASLKVASGQWHTLALKAAGDRFTILFNGKELYSETDKTFPSAGRVALWTKADSVTRFDRLEIRALK